MKRSAVKKLPFSPQKGLPDITVEERVASNVGAVLTKSRAIQGAGSSFVWHMSSPLSSNPLSGPVVSLSMHLDVLKPACVDDWVAVTG